MTERQLHNDNAPAHSTALVQAFFGKASHHPDLSAPPTAQIWLPATFGFSQSSKRRWNGGDLWMWRSHSTQAQSTASHCRVSSPKEVTVHGCTVTSPMTGCHVTSRPRDRFSRYSKWLDTFQAALVLVFVSSVWIMLVCVFYGLDQLCFSWFHLKKEAVRFRNVVYCVEYFYNNGKTSCKCC